MRNVLEDAVREVYDALLKEHPEFCPCAQCRDDVMAYALNNLKPRYTSGGPQSVAYTSLAMQQPSTRSEITVVVFNGLRRVASNPRHALRTDTPDAPGGGSPP